MTLIRDLIDIPDEVRDGDFVLKLTDSVTDDQAAATVDNYEVTEQLADAFTHGLGLVAGALESGRSQATYLHGSFGSGKSHYMAILHLLLQGHPQVRAKTGLHQALAAHGDRLEGKQVLVVPVHFLGARSMEQRIFSAYVDHVQRLHPDAGLPPVFLGDTIVEKELPRLREQLGDEKFLAGLNQAEGGAEADAWGEFGSSWTRQRLDTALAAPATDPERQALVSAYIPAYRPATSQEALTTGEGFVDLTHGLSAVSRHAQQLGYDGVVLFLDELILWLAANMADRDLVGREQQKIVNLVEGAAAPRPVPVVSFIARQRDLRELVGDHITGTEAQGMADTQQLSQGRVGQIVLESRNLPVIAQRRILRPRNDSARDQLRGAVDQALSGRDEVRRVLLGSDADAELFRTVYPFSPTLVNVLIDVSEALQRERTALKVMLQMLVDRRDHLALGDIIPVGDLWDVIVRQDRPQTQQMTDAFNRAKRIYDSRLRPMLLDGYELDEASPRDAAHAAAWKHFDNDDRLMKTLLLAALVPEVDTFRDLSADRLHALNWGTVTAPIPGRETQVVTRKLRHWSTQAGELKVGDDPANPTVSLALVDVDTEPVIAAARQAFDNAGERRKAVRQLLDDNLGERVGADLNGTFTWLWRGTRRSMDVTVANIADERELPDDALRAAADRPRVVINLPFDDGGGDPEGHRSRLDEWEARHQHNPSWTVCWLPSFLSHNGLSALGRYVALNELLRSETRYEQHTQHLNQRQRAELKPLLTQMRNGLQTQLQEALTYAYGVKGSRSQPHELVANGESLTEHFHSLDPRMTIQPTTQPELLSALEQVGDQLMAQRYADHPRFDSEIKPAMVATTWDHIQRGLAATDARVMVERSQRAKVATVAAGLGLGTMGESYLIVTQDWASRLDRDLHTARDERRPVTVADMRSWIDHADNSTGRGLPTILADLIVRTVAAQTNHSLRHGGIPVDDDARRELDPRSVLHPEQLPERHDWERAGTFANAVFGTEPQGSLSGAALAAFAADLQARAAPHQAMARDLVAELDTAYRHCRLDQGLRLQTAQAARELLDQVIQLAGAEATELVTLLARFQAPSSNLALGRSLSTAGEVVDALRRTNWPLLTSPGAGERIAGELVHLLRADELTDPYRPKQEQLELDAGRAAAASAPVGTAPAPAAPPASGGPVDGGAVAGGSVEGGSVAGGPADGAVDTAPPVPPTTAEPDRHGAVGPTVTVQVSSEDELARAVDQLDAAWSDHGPLIVTWRPARSDQGRDGAS